MPFHPAIRRAARMAASAMTESVRKSSIALSAARTGFGPLLWAGDLDRGIRLAAELGFDAVEVSVRDPAEVDVARLEGLLTALRLELSAVATGQSYYTDGLSLCHAEQAMRLLAVGRFKAAADLAASLGGRVILGGIRGPLRCTRAEALETFRTCVAHAAARDVTVLIEPINRYETDFLNNVDDVISLMEQLDASNVKILPDTFHMNIEEPIVADSLRRAGTRIGYVHLADSNRCAPGRGHIDFAEVRSVLDACGFVGHIGFEILPVPDDLTAAREARAHWEDRWAVTTRRWR
jgi:sugar phosphate isomerase/epimerase